MKTTIMLNLQLAADPDRVEQMRDDIRLGNQISTEIGKRAFDAGVYTAEEIRSAVATEELLDQFDVDDESPLVRQLPERIERAFARNFKKYAPVFPADAGILLQESTGGVRWGAVTGGRIADIMVAGKWLMEEFGARLTPLDAELLKHRTGDHALFAHRRAVEGEDCVSEVYTLCLGVACRVPATGEFGEGLLDCVPPTPTFVPDAAAEVLPLERLVPPDHPVRKRLSDYQLQHNKDFSVQDLAVVMNVPAQALYHKGYRGDIDMRRLGTARRIPREEFVRLATLHLGQGSAATREAIAAVAAIEKATQALRLELTGQRDAGPRGATQAKST